MDKWIIAILKKKKDLARNLWSSSKTSSAIKVLNSWTKTKSASDRITDVR